jgi:hypothetical protein
MFSVQVFELHEKIKAADPKRKTLEKNLPVMYLS